MCQAVFETKSISHRLPNDFSKVTIISFYCIRIPKKNNEAKLFSEKAFESGTCVFEKNQNFYVEFVCKRDCAFDVQIDWEEINE